MPDYRTQQELEIMEDERLEKKEQYCRMEQAMSEKGLNLREYLMSSFHLYPGRIWKLENGEESIFNYFDEEISEKLDIGFDWLMYGDEPCKEHPCGKAMKKYLNEHPERREMVWKWMEEDGLKK